MFKKVSNIIHPPAHFKLDHLIQTTFVVNENPKFDKKYRLLNWGVPIVGVYVWCSFLSLSLSFSASFYALLFLWRKLRLLTETRRALRMFTEEKISSIWVISHSTYLNSTFMWNSSYLYHSTFMCNSSYLPQFYFHV